MRDLLGTGWSLSHLAWLRAVVRGRLAPLLHSCLWKLRRLALSVWAKKDAQVVLDMVDTSTCHFTAIILHVSVPNTSPDLSLQPKRHFSPLSPMDKWVHYQM